MNGPVLNRIMEFSLARDKTRFAKTCKAAARAINNHIAYMELWSDHAEGRITIAVGHVLSFRDYEFDHPGDGFYKVKEISPKGMSLRRLTRFSRRTFRKKNVFVSFHFDEWDEEELVKQFRTNEDFLGSTLSEETMEIVARNKKEFLEHWENHCRSVFPVRNRIIQQGRWKGEEELDWQSKRRSKYIWVLEDGSEVLPPCPY